MQLVIMGLYYVLMTVVGSLIWMVGMWFVGYGGFFVTSLMGVVGLFFPSSFRAFVSQNLAEIVPYLKFLSVFVDLNVISFSLNLFVSVWLLSVWIRIVRRFIGHFMAFRANIGTGTGL